MMWEKIWQEDDKHVRGLIGLNNPNLSSFLKADTPYWIVSVYFLLYYFSDLVRLYRFSDFNRLSFVVVHWLAFFVS